MEVLDKLPVAIAFVDAELRYRFANRAYTDLLGYEPADLIGSDARRSVYASHIPLYEREAQRLVQGIPHAFEIALISRGGQLRDLLVQTLPLLDENHAFVGALGFARSALATRGPGDQEDTLRLANLALIYTQALRRLVAGGPSVRLPPTGSIARGQTVPLQEILTPRQREVVSHLFQGLPVAEVARRLYLSPHTVRNHIRAIYRRLGVSSRSELISRFWIRT